MRAPNRKLDHREISGIRVTRRRSSVASALVDDVERAVVERTHEIAEHSAALLRAEKLSFAGQLAAGVAHEINNPLAPLRANIESVGACAQAIQQLGRHADAETRGLIEDLVPAVDEMRACVQRIADLVANFRSLTQLDVDELPLSQSIAVALAEVFDGDVLPLVVDDQIDPDATVVAGPCALRAILKESGSFLVDVVGGCEISASGRAEGDGFALDLFARDAGALSDDELRAAMNPRFDCGGGRLRMTLPLLLAHQLVERGGGVLDVLQDERGIGLRLRLPTRQTIAVTTTPFD